MAVATLVLRTHEPIDFIVTNTQGVEKGTLMMLSGARLASPSTADTASEVFAGVARREKIAIDGRTRLALFTEGIFRMTAASENVTLGAMVSLSGANLIKDATSGELLTGAAFGKALEAITGGSDGEIKVGGKA